MSAKYQYVGKHAHKLAGIGDVVPGQIFQVTDEQAEALEKNAPQLYKRVAEPAKPAAKTAAKPALAEKKSEDGDVQA